MNLRDWPDWTEPAGFVFESISLPARKWRHMSGKAPAGEAQTQRLQICAMALRQNLRTVRPRDLPIPKASRMRVLRVFSGGPLRCFLNKFYRRRFFP
jgi:hypothetical protein